VVGVEGFELSTSSSQSWRSTRLSYTPPTISIALLQCMQKRSTTRPTSTSDRRLSTAAVDPLRPPKPHRPTANKKVAEAPSAKLARPERFELPTTKFVAWYSIQLSYGREEAELFRATRFSSTPTWNKRHLSKARMFSKCAERPGGEGGMLLVHPCTSPSGQLRCTNRLPADSSNLRVRPPLTLAITNANGARGPACVCGGEGGIRTLDRAFDPILP
jgi:hypothetical protein